MVEVFENIDNWLGEIAPLVFGGGKTLEKGSKGLNFNGKFVNILKMRLSGATEQI